jgi:hypothetical protein
MQETRVVASEQRFFAPRQHDNLEKYRQPLYLPEAAN